MDEFDHPVTITRTVSCPHCGGAMLDSDNHCRCEESEVEDGPAPVWHDVVVKEMTPEAMDATFGKAGWMEIRTPDEPTS